MSPSTLNQKSIAPSSLPIYPHWHDIIAGATSGLGARVITAPLDLLKIRRQLQLSHAATGLASKTPASHTTLTSFLRGEWKIFHHLNCIVKKEGGVHSLFRGNVAASYLWVGYSVAQFWLYGYTYECIYHQCSDQTDIKISGAISFTSGAVAGLCATIFTYPFDLCRTIFAARGLFPIAAANVTWSNYTTNLVASTSQQQYVQRRPPKTLHEFARRMYQQKGLRGFYAGSAPGLLQIVPYMGLNFALHDVLVMLSESSDSRVSGVAGMGAGLISKFLVYPLDTIKKRLQAQAFWGSSSRSDWTRRESTKYNTAWPKNPNTYSSRKRVVRAVNKGVGNQQHSCPVLYEGTLHCFKQVARKEGMATFYKGMIPSLLKSSISTGASFWLFTMTKNILQIIHTSDNF